TESSEQAYCPNPLRSTLPIMSIFPSPPGRRKFLKICNRVGIRAHAMKWYSLEGYFPERAVRAVLGPSASRPTPFEKPPDAWDKNKNARIAGAIEWDEIKGSDLGQFLAELQQCACVTRKTFRNNRRRHGQWQPAHRRGSARNCPRS